VWHHAGEYSPERGSVRAWLLVRMRSRSLDRLRSARIARAAVDEVQASSPAETAIVDSPHHKALHQRLREALRTLPEDQQQVLALNYFEGLSASEIGAKLNIPVGTIKSRMLRAMTRLRSLLGEGQVS
jgi:RNA polymerase sigma-70 factor (ECF subfamily)